MGGSSPRATAITESLGDLAMIEAVRSTKRDLVHTRNAFHPLLPAMGAHAYAFAQPAPLLMRQDEADQSFGLKT